jgi:hypothetical protein
MIPRLDAPPSDAQTFAEWIKAKVRMPVAEHRASQL